ncbi:MAG: prenyltransferase [bacterium]
MGRNFFRGAWQLADPKLWIASYIPVTLGIILAVASGFGGPALTDLLWIGAAYVALALIETGKNGINEYIDFISGVDPAVDEAHRTVFSGGKKTITSGLLGTREVLLITFLSFLAAGGVGFALVWFKRPELLPVGAAGAAISILYSLPPFILCYRGLGEPAVAFTYGPLIVSGGYLLIAGRLDVLPLLVSVPVGLIVGNILVINEFPDYEADKQGGKRNLVVRFGKRRAVLLYGFIFIAIYLSCLLPVLHTGSVAWLLPWLTVPLALRAYRNCRENYDNIGLLVASNAATVKIFALTGLLLIGATLLAGI